MFFPLFVYFSAQSAFNDIIFLGSSALLAFRGYYAKRSHFGGIMREYLKKNYFLIKLFELVLDFAFIFLSFFIGLQISETINNGNFWETLTSLFSNLFTGNFVVLKSQLLYFFINILFFNVFQSFVTNKTYREVIRNIVLALLISNGTVIIFSFIFQHSFVSPQAIIFIFLSQVITFGGYKFLLSKLLNKLYQRDVLIIGPQVDADELMVKFLKRNEKDKGLKYVLYEEDGVIKGDLITLINKVDNIIISHSLDESNKNKIVTYSLSQKNKDIYLVPNLYETNIINSRIEQIDDTPVFASYSLHLSITQRFIKRTVDLVLSILMLIITSPFLFLFALLIKLSDKGPVFFKQERVTRGNVPFMLYKFRTMVVDAEKLTGPVWQMENDPRVTKLGKFMRATRIDELPQLINVIRGEMSLIGPRPEREVFIKKFIEDIPDFQYRINVKPGITGLAQVNGKYNSKPIDKLRFDLIYIRKYSIWLDLKILLLTIKAIFDRDSSATKGLPTVEQICEKRNIHLDIIEGGVKIVKNEKN